MKKFIRTVNADTAAQLRKAGFQEVISGQKDVFLFVNDKLLFQDNPNLNDKNITFTNLLFM